jgi:hypothetical protein
MPNRRVALVAALFASGLALSGCSVIGDVLGGNGNVFDLAVGDCVNDASLGDETVTSVPVVDCAEPHDSEIYYRHVMTQSSYPGTTETTNEADIACSAAFEDFIGIPYADSVLYLSYFYPTETTWATGDRETLCLVYDRDGQTTGSLAGAAR